MPDSGMELDMSDPHQHDHVIRDFLDTRGVVGKGHAHTIAEAFADAEGEEVVITCIDEAVDITPEQFATMQDFWRERDPDPTWILVPRDDLEFSKVRIETLEKELHAVEAERDEYRRELFSASTDCRHYERILRNIYLNTGDNVASPETLAWKLDKIHETVGGLLASGVLPKYGVLP